ncbi:phenylacetaldoxime dehydratase family protein [Acinetobacter nectaris]|nr:phenylacetaldoxime dehydratase family protein [Acinetobacter nectaris]
MDKQKYHHLVITAYWSDAKEFQQWWFSSGFNIWWESEERELDLYGYFLEVYHPTTSEFETIFSNPNTPEGIAHLASTMSDEIQEHAYYGSMRDCIPKAQKSDLIGENDYLNHTSIYEKRIKIIGKKNLCIIRSGQDWEETAGKERKLYLDEVEPILRQGMSFLESYGLEEGCLNCRYMSVLDKKTGEPLNKTFGLAYFIDLKHLEDWAKSHPTHVKIFGSFMKYVQEMQFKINLKLFHEVMSLPQKSQYFEYIQCYAKTGLLNTFSLK